MFIAAIFTIAKSWKQHKCLLTDEWIKNMWNIYIHIFVYIHKHNGIIYIHKHNGIIYIHKHNGIIHKHNGIILSHKKKNEIMPFAATWMDPEIVILSEISQTEKNK